MKKFVIVCWTHISLTNFSLFFGKANMMRFILCKLDLESREREGAKSRRPMKLPFEILLCLNFNYIGSIHVNEFGSIG